MQQTFFLQPNNLVNSNMNSLYVLPWLNMNQAYLQQLAHFKAAAQLKEQQIRFQIQAKQMFQNFPIPNFSYHPSGKIESFYDYQTQTAEFSHTEASPNESSQGKNTPFSEDYSTHVNVSSIQPIHKTGSLPQPDQDENIKFHVHNMIKFFVEGFGKTKSQEDVEKERHKYAFSQALIDLFDAVKSKYSSSTKCREDMVRLVLRKALTYIRDSIREKERLSAKAASVVLCKKYFATKIHEMMKEEEIDFENEEEVLGFLLPYKKNSRNKTVNTCFIKEIFASEIFYEDYLKFLAKFDEVLELDNQKKISKFEIFLIKCVKENAIAKVKGFKRLPWLISWCDTTKVIAYELLNANTWKTAQKRSKNKKTKGKNQEINETEEF